MIPGSPSTASHRSDETRNRLPRVSFEAWTSALPSRRRISFLAVPANVPMSHILGVRGIESQMKSLMERYPIYRRLLVCRDHSSSSLLICQFVATAILASSLCDRNASHQCANKLAGNLRISAPIAFWESEAKPLSLILSHVPRSHCP